MTQTSSAMKGAEERDLILGRLLGIAAVALSGRLKTDVQGAVDALQVCEVPTNVLQSSRPDDGFEWHVVTKQQKAMIKESCYFLLISIDISCTPSSPAHWVTGCLLA